ELPPGSTLEATEGVLRQLEAKIVTVPEINYFQTTSGAAGGNAFGGAGGGARLGRIQVTLVDRAKRKRSSAEVAEELSKEEASLAGAVVRASAAGGGAGGQPISVQISGDDTLELRRIAAQVEALLVSLPTVRNVTNSAQAGNPETRMVPNRPKMADLGISAQQAGLALRTAAAGVVATKLRPENADEVDVRLIATVAARNSLTQLEQMPLTATQGGQTKTVTPGQIARAEQVSGPSSVSRKDRQQVVTVGAGLAPGVVLTDVTVGLQKRITELNANPDVVPPGYRMTLGGQAEQQSKAFANLFLALGLSVGLEYMLLAALYESMILPFATMFALPVAMVGALLALALTHNTLNLLSMIGVIVLMGLVGKNGILLVDLTNTLRQEGRSREDAILEAGPTRLRPILMTTLALVFGMLPLALGLEEGSEIYKAMATVIIGGMLSSTLLSLIVVPCVYTYFDDLQNLIVATWGWRPYRRNRYAFADAPHPMEAREIPATQRTSGEDDHVLAGAAPTARTHGGAERDRFPDDRP
ncbi:MAG: efflux RND transporter permease subunit, partial [Chloroflexi bacterium]|nr:efflux RND transporter permease subunit [Chloroflexota bacterium]